MKILTTYKNKIRDTHGALADTVEIYRQAVDFLIGVALEKWDALPEERLQQLSEKELIEVSQGCVC